MSEIKKPAWGSGQNQSSPDQSDTIRYLSVAKEVDVSSQQFLSDSYDYTGGYKNGLYLIPFPIEGYYDQRRDYSTYTNFFAPIVNSTINPCFAKPATRAILSGADTEVNDSKFLMFLADCDNRGNSFQKWMKENAAKYGRVHSRAFVVVDNFTADQMPDTDDEAVKGRKFPYIYIKTSIQVGRYENDEFGNLQTVSFYDRMEKIEGERRSIYKHWTAEESTEEYLDMQGKWITVGEPKIHGLGTLPVAVVGDAQPNDTSKLMPEPRLYGVGRMVHSIFNKDSEMRHLERVCMFPMLTVQGNANDLAGGASSIMFYSENASQSPQWIQPDAGLMQALGTQRNNLRDDMFAMVEQLGVVAKKTAISGVALAYEFQAHSDVLDETANMCEDCERQIMAIFGEYVDWTQYKYSVQYNREYLPYDTSENIVHDSFLVDILGIPAEFKFEVIEDHLKRRFPDMEKERIDEIIQIARGDLENDKMIINSDDKEIIDEEMDA